MESAVPDTLGRQIINSADSIGANIAEGTGRGSFADNRRFAKLSAYFRSIGRKTICEE